MRARSSEVSIDTIGFDIADLLSMGEELAEADFEISAEDSTLERHPSSAAMEKRELYADMYAQSATMREFEHLIMAFDALEAWADCWDDFQTYVAPDALTCMPYKKQDSNIRALATRTHARQKS
jgi:hypothetical protein